MREILFRGKDTKNGEWIEGWFCGGTCIHPFSKAITSSQIIDKDLYWHEIDCKSVGQFTGLTDKNGKKIFEGDIIQSVETDETGIVQWFPEHSAFMVWDKSSNEVGFLYECVEITKVIGNIHDNPELLTEQEG